MHLKRHRTETHKFSSCLVLYLKCGVLLGSKAEKRDSVRMSQFFFFPVIKQVNLTNAVDAGAPVYYKLKKKNQQTQNNTTKNTNQPNKKTLVFRKCNAVKLSCLFGLILMVMWEGHMFFWVCAHNFTLLRHLWHIANWRYPPSPGCLQMICNSVVFLAAAGIGLCFNVTKQL